MDERERQTQVMTINKDKRWTNDKDRRQVMTITKDKRWRNDKDRRQVMTITKDKRWTNDKDRRQVMTITKDTCIYVAMLDNNSFIEIFQIYISVNSYKH